MALTRRGALGVAAIAVTLTVGLAGCSNASTIGGTSSSSTTTASAGSSASKTLVVGSANFGESEILAYVYGGALADKGYTISYNVNIGARTAYLGALKGGQINLVPEYSGALLNYLDPTATAASGSDQTAAITGKISSINAKAFDLAPGADSDSINVTGSFASAHGLTSIADLSKAGTVTVAAAPEAAAAKTGWFPKLIKAYGLKNLKFKAINDGGGKTTVSALTSNQVQAADIYSTTPSITANKLTTLSDPKNVFAAQQVLPVVSADKATTAVGDILNPVSAKLTTAELLALNTTANGSAKPDYQTIAKDWLSKNGF